MVERQKGKGGSYGSPSFTGYDQAAPQVSTSTECGGHKITGPRYQKRIVPH